MSEPTNVKDALAEAAVKEIESGMLVGLGTGRTAKRGIRALADRVREESLEIACVCTSDGSENLARELGMTVIEFAINERPVDYLFDGANEIDRELRVLKGSNGAVTRERLVAHASHKVVYMVDEGKVVDRLGTHNTLCVAVIPFGLASVRAELRSRGLIGVVRRDINGQFFISDNGNMVLDLTIPDSSDLEELAYTLNDIPGIVDHGLFLTEADEILIEADGGIDRLIRQPDPA